MTTATAQAPTTTTNNNSNGKAKKPGQSYDVCKVEMGENGVKKFTNLGTLFLRENGSGGVMYLRNGVDADGKKLPDTELAIFRKLPRQG
jgi:hypothetical protein